MEARFYKHLLQFKNPSGTSRGVLHQKETYILEIFTKYKKGIGECSVFRGLSYDDVPEYDEKLNWLCENINLNIEVLKDELHAYPSIIFGLEQAILNLKHGSDLYFPSDFTNSKATITINGLIWMGSPDFMKSQIENKLKQGYHCLKLKIGSDWKSENDILKNLRKQYPEDVLTIRVDANGAFGLEEVKPILQDLAHLKIHSIEQPIKACNYTEMAQLCKETPIPIALDEELIGILKPEEKKELLENLKPQFIILKPSLIGGFAGTEQWISSAENLGINWWITSALESNIGLNAIAQYTFTKQTKIPQGLGTGSLFTNNFATRLYLESDQLLMKKV